MCSSFPLVSIITPSYNQGTFIRETIESVLQQDYPNIEYWVIDGGSTDDTVKILTEYGDQLHWISEKDNGQADALNKGIALTHGQIIGWLNSDDIYLPHTIHKIVEYWKQNPQADLIYGNAHYIDRNSCFLGDYLTEPFSLKRLSEQCIICQPTAFFSREIIHRIGGLNTEYQLGMDYELWLRISRFGQINYYPDYLASSRMYEENKTLSRKKEAYEEACKAVKKHCSYVPSVWTRGFAYYLCGEKKSLRYYLKTICLHLKYNRNPLCFLKYLYRFGFRSKRK